MTDKIPQDKTKSSDNTQEALARTNNTVSDGVLKSRVLPQADALKERFKAGSIPLQSDFADLVELANMGRLAVGGGEGQNGPANGLTLSSMGLLELKSGKGIEINNTGLNIKLSTYSGLSVNEINGLNVIADTKAGVQVKADGIGLTYNAWANIMCALHNANFYAMDSLFAVFFHNTPSVPSICVAHVYIRGYCYIVTPQSNLKLNDVEPDNIISSNVSDSNYQCVTTMSWTNMTATAGMEFKYYSYHLAPGIANSSGTMTLVAAP